jgi:hypothetical protein
MTVASPNAESAAMIDAPAKYAERGTRWLLWATAMAALAIGGTAFFLWGTNSAAYMFDLIAAYCFS